MIYFNVILSCPSGYFKLVSPKNLACILYFITLQPNLQPIVASQLQSSQQQLSILTYFNFLVILLKPKQLLFGSAYWPLPAFPLQQFEGVLNKFMYMQKLTYKFPYEFTVAICYLKFVIHILPVIRVSSCVLTAVG